MIPIGRDHTLLYYLKRDVFIHIYIYIYCDFIYVYIYIYDRPLYIYVYIYIYRERKRERERERERHEFVGSMGHRTGYNYKWHRKFTDNAVVSKALEKQRFVARVYGLLSKSVSIHGLAREVLAADWGNNTSSENVSTLRRD